MIIRTVVEHRDGLGRRGASITLQLYIAVNHAHHNDLAANISSEIVAAKVEVANAPPIVAREEFAFMLAARRGYMIFIGNGDSAACHHSRAYCISVLLSAIPAELSSRSLDPCHSGRQGGAHSRSFPC